MIAQAHRCSPSPTQWQVLGPTNPGGTKEWILVCVKDIMTMHLIAHDMSISKIEESESTETIIDRDDHNTRFHQRPWVVVMPCALRNEKFPQSFVQNLKGYNYPWSPQWKHLRESRSSPPWAWQASPPEWTHWGRDSPPLRSPWEVLTMKNNYT